MSSTSPSYRRVAQRAASDPAAVASSSGDIFEVQPTRSRNERFEDKWVAFCWVVVACIVARYTNFFSIVFLLNTDTTTTGTDTTNDDNDSTSASTSTSENNLQPNKMLLRIAFVGFGIVTTLFLYLTLYLPKMKGLNDPSVWNVYCPKVVPIMGITSIMTYLILIRAIWPIFGFLSPLISGTEIMGLLMATHFIPAFGLC